MEDGNKLEANPFFSETSATYTNALMLGIDDGKYLYIGQASTLHLTSASHSEKLKSNSRSFGLFGNTYKDTLSVPHNQFGDPSRGARPSAAIPQEFRILGVVK